MSPAFDLGLIERSRELANALAPSPRGMVTRIPDLRSCTYQPGSDSFRVLFEDLVAADVPRAALRDVENRSVVSWSIDEFKRGVVVGLDDCETTSFSAEFARTFGDPNYRRWVEARRAGTDADLAQRVAERVQKLRVDKGWSVAELGRRAEMAAPNVHRVESARHVPSTRTMLRLAQALGVPLARLVQVSARAR